MDKKITRRVVLGSTIAALAAGPFVIRAMRGRQVGLLSDCDRLWQHYFDKFAVPISNVVKSVPLRLTFSPAEIQKARVLTLAGQFPPGREVAELSRSVSPAVFSVVDAGLRSDVENKCLIADVDDHKVVDWSSGEKQMERMTLCFSIDNSTLSLAAQKKNGIKLDRPESSDLECAEILKNALCFSFPKDEVGLGSKWMQSTDYMFFNSVPCVVDSVCQVQGVEAVKVMSSVVYDTFRPMPVPPADVHKDQLEYYTEGQFKGFFSMLSYVSVKTGLLIRQESLMNLTINTPREKMQSESAFFVSQVFFS